MAAFTENDVRVFAKDKAADNPLLGAVRFTTEDILAATNLAVDYINYSLPPLPTKFTKESFPSSYVLLLGTCGHLLRGASVNQASNQLTYAVDSVQIGDMDKAKIFSELGNSFWGEFQQMVRDIKVTENIADAYGATRSNYGFRSW